MNRISFLSAILSLSLAAGNAADAAPARHATRGRSASDRLREDLTAVAEQRPLGQGLGVHRCAQALLLPGPSAGVRSAVIVLPGGGYTHVVMEKEGAVEAKWLAARGVAAFVLQYRLAPAYRYPVPMMDGARAVRYVRSHAAEFGIDPNKIGVWGFSAGGTPGRLSGDRTLRAQPREHRPGGTRHRSSGFRHLLLCAAHHGCLRAADGQHGVVARRQSVAARCWIVSPLRGMSQRTPRRASSTPPPEIKR